MLLVSMSGALPHCRNSNGLIITQKTPKKKTAGDEAMLQERKIFAKIMLYLVYKIN